jgi:bacterioferritin
VSPRLKAFTLLEEARRAQVTQTAREQANEREEPEEREMPTSAKSGKHGRGFAAMQGDKRVIEFLNEQLTAELTAINQYWLHYKLQENHGWVKLAAHTRRESIEEMEHADKLAERIIFLEGLPNFQKLSPLRIGQSVTEMLECDMKVEVEAVDRLRRGIKYMREKDDVTSANLFEEILANEEEHIDYLETQLGLLRQLGEPLYLAQLVEQPHAS